MISNRNIRIYYLTQFFEGAIFTLPIIIVFLQARMSLVQVSLIYSWRYLTQLLAELPTGAFADILGRKISISLSYVSFILCYVLLPFTNNFTQILLLFTFSGIGNALVSGAFEALIYDSLKQDGRGPEFSLIQAKQSGYFQTAMIIATLTGGFLYTLNSRLPFWGVAIGAIISMASTFWLIEPKIDTVKFTLKNYWRQIKIGVQELTKNTKIKNISAFYILVGGITWTCAMYFNSYMFVDLGFNDQMRGILEGSLRLINVLIITQILKQSKWFTRKISYLFFPVVMIAAFLPGIWLKGLFALPFIAGSMMAATARWIILAKYTNEEFDSRYRATAISALSMGVGIIYVIITAASGPIIANFGGVRTVYTLLGLLSLILLLPVALKIVRANH